MRRIAVITRIGKNDTKKLSTSKDLDLAVNLPVFNSNLSAEERVTHERIFSEAKRLGLGLSETAIDLIFLGISVHAADTRIVRTLESQDGWSREIDLYLPVSDPSKWSGETSRLESTLHFLTGDFWRLFFRERVKEVKHIAPKPEERVLYDTNTLSLFSGGLDSFIGAIDLFESGVTPVFLRHHSSTDVGAPQTTSAELLRKRYKTNVPDFIDAFVRIPAKPFGKAKEDTTRGRSFLFLSLGAAFASSLSTAETKLIVPENGFISLNVPLTPLRLGSLTTRTTHPHFVRSFQEFLKEIGLPVTIENPYQFKTKGEMLLGCRNQKSLGEGAADTMSCSHPSVGRFGGGRAIGHCGYCVPCLIRQAAFKKAFGTDPTWYRTKITSKRLNPRTSEGEQVRAFKLAANRTAIDTETAKLMIRLSGPLPADTQFLDKAAGVYQRGMKEVADLLADVKTK